MALPQEDRLYHHKLHRVVAYARANGLNRLGGALDDARELGFDEGDLAALDRRDGVGVDVDPDDVRAAVGDRRGGRESDVPEADDGDDTDVQVLSDLFVAADRLHAGPNGEAVSAFLDAAEQVGERPPYGVDDRDWEAVLELVDQLVDLFHAGGPDEQAIELAYQLRRRLRPLV